METNKTTLGQLTYPATHLGYSDAVTLERILREKGTLTFLCFLDRIEVANARRYLSYRFLQVLFFIYAIESIVLNEQVSAIYNELGINQMELFGNDTITPKFDVEQIKEMIDGCARHFDEFSTYDKALINALPHLNNPWVIHSIVARVATENKLHGFSAILGYLDDVVKEALKLTNYR